MGLFRGRYFCIGLWFFLCAAAVALLFGINIFLFSLAALVVVFGIVFLIFNKKSKNLLAVLILSLVLASLGGLRSYLHISYVDDMAEKYSGDGEIYGYVADVDYRNQYYSAYKVKVERVNGNDESFYAVFLTEFDSELARGDFISAKVSISDMENIDSSTYYDKDCILMCELLPDEEIIYEKSEFRFSLMLSSMRAYMSAFLRENIDGESGELASAFILGERELVKNETMRDFRRTGLIHLLSLSGTHISIIIGMLDLLLRKLRLPKWFRCIIATFLSFFYIALTGFLPSACRSMLMLWFLYLAFCFGRSADPVTSLFVSVSLIVVLSPEAVADIGLLLSFLATLGVIIAFLIAPKFEFMKKEIKGRGIKKRLVKSLKNIFVLLISSFFVFVLTLPVMYLVFGEVSLASFFANIFMGAICEAFMICAIFVLLLSPLAFLCRAFALFAQISGELMVQIIAKISDIENIVLSLRYDFAGILVWFVFVATLVFLMLRFKRIWHIFLPSAVFALSFCIAVICFNALNGGYIRSEFISADGGEAFVFSSDDEVYIVDFSNGAYSPLYDARNIAEENCYTEIDGIILTHYHKGHLKTLTRLCSSEKVRRIYLPPPESEEELLVFSALDRRFRESDVELIMYEYENVLPIAGGELLISGMRYNGKNAHSAQAMSFSFGGYDITYAESGFFDDAITADMNWIYRFHQSELFIYGSHGFDSSYQTDISQYLGEDTEVYFVEEWNYGCFDSDINVKYLKKVQKAIEKSRNM